MNKYGLPSNIVEIENHIGHWKIGTGALGLVDEVRESRKIGSRVHAILKASSVPSTYFQDETSTNKNNNLKTLVKHHNADTNGLVVSWHLNASGAVTQSGVGTEVLYANEKWKPLAEALSAAIAKAGNFKNRGAKLRKELYVLNNTKEPAILVETFFVNSTADVAMYNRHFEDICQAAATVLAGAIGKMIKEPSKETESVKKEETKVIQLLNETGRTEIRALLKKARNEKIIDTAFHTDAKIDKYTDIELLSYQSAIVNRTLFK